MELALDRLDRPVGGVGDPFEQRQPDVPRRVSERRVGVVEAERPVDVALEHRVPADLPPGLLDGTARETGPLDGARRPEVAVGAGELDGLGDVALAVDVVRKEDEVDLLQEVRRQSLLDDAVDERLDVLRVGGADGMASATF